jgi:hypothetical protein
MSTSRMGFSSLLGLILMPLSHSWSILYGRTNYALRFAVEADFYIENVGHKVIDH